MGAPSRRHHLVVRITHWVNALALFVMVGSGLRIFNSYPAFARKGETFCCYPFAGRKIPEWLTFGGWLGGARHWHFAAMWLLVANGLVYLAFIYLHGEWRDLAPSRGVARDSLEMVRFYLALRKDHPRQGKHNALQRMAYFTMPYVGAAAVISGLAVWKPVQFAPLTHLLGGFVWARYWHFLAMVALVFLTVGHVFMVFAVDPYSLRSMVTGGYNEARSPEARNARPFLRLFVVPQPAPEPNPQPPAGEPPGPITPDRDPTPPSSPEPDPPAPEPAIKDPPTGPGGPQQV